MPGRWAGALLGGWAGTELRTAAPGGQGWDGVGEEVAGLGGNCLELVTGVTNLWV